MNRGVGAFFGPLSDFCKLHILRELESVFLESPTTFMAHENATISALQYGELKPAAG
jgi:hypothetical protein